MIYGFITRQGTYSDRKDMCEIHVSVASFEELPHKYQQKSFIDLTIGNTGYIAGVHENKRGQVWISSVLHKNGPEKEKIRLIDALEGICLKWQDRIIIIKKGQKYILRPEKTRSLPC